MKHAPDFKTHGEHDAWVTANAEYFTVIVPAYRIHYRIEFKTLEQAREIAKKISETRNRNVLIYAVCGVYSCYVETISK